MTKDCINHWVINPLQKSTINSLLDDKWDWSSNVLKEKTEGRKSQSLPFLLSKNMRKYTLKNAGFCPNKVIHFRIFFGILPYFLCIINSSLSFLDNFLVKSFRYPYKNP